MEAAVRLASRISGEAGARVVDTSGFISLAELLSTLTARSPRRACTPLQARSVLSALSASREGPFGAYARTPSFARAAVELFEELKLGNAGASELGAAGQALGGLKRERLLFLGELFLGYQKELRARGWADRADRIQLATEALEEGLPDALQRFARIELRGLYDFPPARLSLVLALWRACERAQVDFFWEVPAGLSPAVDVAVDGVLAAVERVGQELAGGQVCKEDLEERGRPLAWLGRVLFSGEETAPLAAPLERVSAPTARAECVVIARRVRRWINEGIPAGEIAVAFRDLGEEAEAVEEALAALGVRARARRGVPLSATATGRALLSLPGLAEDGFRAEEVAAFLGGGRLPALSRTVPDAPLKWFLRAGLKDDRQGASGRKGAYALRLEGLAERLRAKGAGREADAAQRLLAGCRQLFEACARIPEEGTALAMVQGWTGAVGALVSGAEPPKFDPSMPTASLKAIASEQRALAALAGLGRELSDALAASGAGARRMGRRELQTLLWDAAAEVNVPGAGLGLGAVHILELRELVGQRFARVALGGFNEGRFPTESARGGLLSDEERFAVNQAAKRDVFRDLAGELDGRLRWGIAEDRLLLFQALASAEGGAWISFARIGADGQPGRPSAFFEELGRRVLAPVRVVPASVAPALEDVLGERELRLRLALEAAVCPELRLSAPALGPEARAALVGAEPWLAEVQTLAGIEAERLRFFASAELPPGPFSGALTGVALERARAALVFGPDHPLSASTLGTFGNCRFKGLLAHVLHLGALEEAGEDLDARTRGTFWHAVLRELFQAMGKAGLLGKGSAEVPQALVDEAIRAAVEELERSAPVGHPDLWALSQERARAMVRRVLDAEDHGLPFGATRVFSELPFGTQDAPAPFRSVQLPGREDEGDVYLRGAIDRFDVAEDAGGVIDFKAKRLELGKLTEDLLVSDFQLPFYLHAVRSGGHGAVRRAGWMSLREAKVIELDTVLAKEGTATVEDLLATAFEQREALASAGALNLANRVHEILKTVRSGDFGPRAHDCDFCEFRSVCRIGGAKGRVAE